jgi:hypothetical protein
VTYFSACEKRKPPFGLKTIKKYKMTKKFNPCEKAEPKTDVCGSTLNTLPPLGQIVEAKVRFTRIWPECLGGLKITDKILLVRRIKSKYNSQGWQWSGAETDTTINGNIVEWHYR